MKLLLRDALIVGLIAVLLVVVGHLLAETPPKPHTPSKIQSLTLEVAQDKAKDAYQAYVGAVNALNIAGEEVKKENAACDDAGVTANECVKWPDAATLQFHGDTLAFAPPPTPPKAPEKK